VTGENAPEEQWDATEAAASVEAGRPGGEGAGKEEDPPAKTRYANAAEWVEHYLLPHFARNPMTIKWCAYWWEHAEAASRLEALWQAWEAARVSTDGDAVSNWWLQHADPHMTALFSDQGTFNRCDYQTGTHRVFDTLPVAPPPEGMYRSRDHPEEQPPPANNAAAEGGGQEHSQNREQGTTRGPRTTKQAGKQQAGGQGRGR
jgi:hypothetical protein